jgi:N-acetyl-D-muramate 6-phosphate phosphatase
LIVPHNSSLQSPKAVFFDLDGTLADTAQDLVNPVNAMRQTRGLEPLPFEELRPYASAGARGLIGKGFGIPKESAEFPAMRDEFLSRYEQAMLVQTRLFDGMPVVLELLDSRGIVWGVVSNKFERYVRQILIGLGLDTRSAVIIGGDTTPNPKPHPAPLLLACEQTGFAPQQCVYLGDDKRDIEAGAAAGMATIACAYGFCGDVLPPQQWQADHLIHHPSELLSLWANTGLTR